MEKTKRSLNICYLSDAPTIHTQRWVQEFARRGHRVSVISFRPYEIEGVNVINIDQWKFAVGLEYVFLAPRVRQIIKELHVDILHAHYCTSYGFVGAASGIHPFVVTAWGSDVLISPEKSILYRMLVRWVFDRADLVTSMAEHMTIHLLQRKYVKPDKLITLPFGVDTNQFHPGHMENVHNGSPYLVLSTRRLDSVCDISTFIQAIPLVLKVVPQARFVVASEGPLRQELEVLATRLNIGNQISFAGWIPQEELPRLLAKSDIMVSTAYSDGNNVSLNEAMACGAFPIATDIPANREWLESGKNGLLFPPGDWNALAENIINALHKPELRREAAKSNWEIVKSRASWSASMTRMEQQYHRLFNLSKV